MIKKTIKKITEINKQITITSAIVSLSAKVACADGGDMFLKKKVFFDIFKAHKKEKKNIEKIFDLASQETAGFATYAKTLQKKFKKSPEVLEEVLVAMLKIAKANGVLKDESLEMLKQIAKLFKISEKDFIRVCNINNVYDFSNPYVILGVPADISKEDLKEHYKKLAKKYHPDHLISCGMPQEMMGLLENKMAEINKAYNNIKKEK
jgi:DnaJ like chaperone protein